MHRSLRLGHTWPVHSERPMPLLLDAANRAAAARDAGLSPAARSHRGVVHTPPVLAMAMAHAVHGRLVTELGLVGGLANGRVMLADPACGPGVFLAGALATAGMGGRPRACVGFDIDEGAISAAEETLRASFDEAGWPLTLRVADTLSLGTPADVFGEAASADGVIVVLGNPPWAARSANRKGASTALLRDFAMDHAGLPLGERKAGVLSDDYVRFFRWACELVRQSAAGGVVAFVTNASFLDGPVHRGMRARLLEWFDGIDTIDLGGSALIARRGDRDENVFGVRPAAAITIAWRGARASSSVPTHARLRAQSLRGSRDEKLSALADGVEPGYTAVATKAPFFPFRAGQAVDDGPYDGWPSLIDLIPFHQEGVQTNRDALVVDVDRGRLLDRLHAFAKGDRLGVPDVAWRKLAHYDPDVARAAVAAMLAADPDGTLGHSVRRIAWRPGDVRWFCPVPPACHRARPALLRAIDDQSVVLLTARKDRGERPWTHVGASLHIPDNCWLSTRSSCRTRAFPARMPGGEGNLSPAAARVWSEVVGRSVTAEEVLLYALAVLSAPAYQRRFDARLREDYARIPVPDSEAMLLGLTSVGRRLLRAHVDTASTDGTRVAAEAVVVGHQSVVNASLASAMAAADAVLLGHLPFLRQ